MSGRRGGGGRLLIRNPLQSAPACMHVEIGAVYMWLNADAASPDPLDERRRALSRLCPCIGIDHAPAKRCVTGKATNTG